MKGVIALISALIGSGAFAEVGLIDRYGILRG